MSGQEYFDSREQELCSLVAEEQLSGNIVKENWARGALAEFRLASIHHEVVRGCIQQARLADAELANDDAHKKCKIIMGLETEVAELKAVQAKLAQEIWVYQKGCGVNLSVPEIIAQARPVKDAEL